MTVPLRPASDRFGPIAEGASVIEIGSRPVEVRTDEKAAGHAVSPAVKASGGAVAATIVHENKHNERVALLTKLLVRLGAHVEHSPRATDVKAGRAAAGERHLVIVADDGPDPALADDAVGLAASGGASRFVVYVADTMPVESYKRLVRTGAGEWVQWQSVTRELGEALRQFESTSTLRAPAREPATIISFLPSKGGAGNTTLAIETAVSLVYSHKALKDRVAIVDLNFQGGSLGDALDLPSRFDIAEIVARPDRLDSRLIDVFASKHASLIDVFACLPRFGQELIVPPDVIFAFLDQLGSRYDFVLLDLPARWDPWVDNVLLGSSATVVTGEGTVPGLRQVTQRLAHLEALGIDAETCSVTVNRCSTGAFGRVASRAHIERALPDRRIHFVPSDPSLAAEAVNTGQPMARISPRRKISKAIRKLGDWAHTLRKA